jgi:hypothetical protein
MIQTSAMLFLLVFLLAITETHSMDDASFPDSEPKDNQWMPPDCVAHCDWTTGCPDIATCDTSGCPAGKN